MADTDPWTNQLRLETRNKTQIKNHLDRGNPHPGLEKQTRDHAKQYPAAWHRKVGPCISYNCHGLTFGARRTAILEPREITTILTEDDYIEVKRQNVSPGDIAVYLSTGAIAGEIEHTGIVVERIQQEGLLNFRILSKWGACDEVVHFVADCPYDSKDVRYFRVYR